MNSIDWTWAPEGATHALLTTAGSKFFKQDHAAYDWVNGKWRHMGPDLGECVFAPNLIERPAPRINEQENVAPDEWDGEGFPPAGTSCEGYIYADTAKQGAPMNRWAKGEFVGEAWADNGVCMGLLKTDDGRIHAIGAFSYFRPVRTPEQIAEDERQAFIEQVINDSMGRCDVPGAAYLYESGYRKP